MDLLRQRQQQQPRGGSVPRSGSNKVLRLTGRQIGRTGDVLRGRSLGLC